MTGGIDFELLGEMFAASVEWAGDGRTRARLGGCELEICNPLEVPPGSSESITWPEQLLPAALAACWITTMTTIAGRMRVGIESLKVTVKPILGVDSDGGFRFEEMRVNIEIKPSPGVTRDRVERLVSLTHKYCLISKAIKGNVEERVSLTLLG